MSFFPDLSGYSPRERSFILGLMIGMNLDRTYLDEESVRVFIQKYVEIFRLMENDNKGA